MPVRTPTPAEIVETQMAMLERLVRNLLLDNVDFRNGRYASEHPSTGAFVAGPLASMAETIIERIDEVKAVAVDMAAAPRVPGVTPTYSGVLHGDDVSAAETDSGQWVVSIEVPYAFSNANDYSGTYASEAAALAAVAEFAATGRIPSSMHSLCEHGGVDEPVQSALPGPR